MDIKIKNFLDENIEKTVKFSPENEGNLIGLPYPYTTPCAEDSFQEMYYWDTYFTNAGLLLWGKTEYAKNNIENMLYLIEKYGFMPNGNRTFYLNRSQPPFLSHMVRDFFEVTGDKEWLSRAYNTLVKEYDFWQTKRVAENGLNGYTGYEIWERIFENNYNYFVGRTGYKPQGEVDYEEQKKIYFATVSVCESGWDCNSRFLADGHLYNAIDLNALIYGMEDNMQYFASVLGNGEQEIWENRKEERVQKMQLMWDNDRELFMDYNFKTNEFSKYASVASFYPMFTKLATKEQAAKTMKFFDKINLEFGISCGEADPQWNCQWDYPNVWAPLQFIMYKALMNYGYEYEAKTVAEKYVKLIESNFEETQNFWEKYDGTTGKVAANEYKAPKMVGWTAGVYIYFNKELGLI
ncbi:MAG: hypothetical protein IKY45_03750 [Clostridia bacterium]|nr:hypothetical protein [Clostridia bacterium]